MLEFLPWQVLSESVGWHLLSREIRNFECSFPMLLSQLHVLYVYMAQPGADSLVLAYYESNRLLIITENPLRLPEIKGNVSK